MARRNSFNPSAPNRAIWFIALIIGLLGLIATFVPMATVSVNAFWLVAAGYILLLIGTSMKGV